jgi:hypothetical protein
VLPGVVERHGVAVTRIMLASTVAGEAPASAIIRDLLKSDELVALPKAEEVTIAPLIDTQKRSDEEQAAIKAKRAEAKAAKKEAERARKAQAGRRPQPLSVTPCTVTQGPTPDVTCIPAPDVLVVEQPGLGVDAAGEARQRAVRSDHTVARHDDRDRVPPVRRTDRPSLAPVAHAGSLLAVADGGPVRIVRSAAHADRWKSVPTGSSGTSNSCRARRSTRRVARGREHRVVGVARSHRRERTRCRVVVRPQDRAHAGIGRDDRERADGCVDDVETSSLMGAHRC